MLLAEPSLQALSLKERSAVCTLRDARALSLLPPESVFLAGSSLVPKNTSYWSCRCLSLFEGWSAWRGMREQEQQIWTWCLLRAELRAKVSI